MPHDSTYSVYDEFYYIIGSDDANSDSWKLADEIYEYYGGRETVAQRCETLWELCDTEEEYEFCVNIERAEWIAWWQIMSFQEAYPPRIPSRYEVKKQAGTLRYAP